MATIETNTELGRQIVEDAKRYVLYSWSVQNAVNPIAELGTSNTVVRRFVYATKFNAPDYMIRDGVAYRILSDHLGSPRLVVDTGAFMDGASPADALLSSGGRKVQPRRYRHDGPHRCLPPKSCWPGCWRLRRRPSDVASSSRGASTPAASLPRLRASTIVASRFAIPTGERPPGAGRGTRAHGPPNAVDRPGRRCYYSSVVV